MNTKLRISFILLTFLHASTGCIPDINLVVPTTKHSLSTEPIFTPTPAPSTETTPITSSSMCKCGVPQGNRNRIVGGQPVTKNEFPWLVALVRAGSVQPFCGGTLISSKTVLTAAHCTIFSNSEVRVHVGEHDVAKADGEQIIGVKNHTKHPQYDSRTTDNDFAVIELSRSVTFSKTIMPICLPNAGKNSDNMESTAVGWGTRSFGTSSSPRIPYEVDLKSITNTACTTNTAYEPGMITNNMICAKESGKDSCQGDSGGPLMTKENNYYSLIGVVSWGEGCAESNAPGVYARVTSQIRWIKDEIKGTTCPEP